jgi:sugar lactone lactonase YvrE
VLQRIELDRNGFACMLGGDDGNTLFMLVADWHMQESISDNMLRLTTGPHTGQLLTTRVSAAAVGWP